MLPFHHAHRDRTANIFTNDGHADPRGWRVYVPHGLSVKRWRRVRAAHDVFVKLYCDAEASMKG